MNIVQQLAADFIGLLYPSLCNGCGTPLVRGEKQICISCLHDLPFTDFQSFADNQVHQLFWGRLHCDNAMAMLYFRKGSKVQQLIHRLKYKNQTELGIILGQMIGRKLLTADAYRTAELVIPVPLHPKKEKSRGYNQSKYIADGIAAIMDIPVSTTHLIRQRETTSQTKKSRYSRFENMQYVFTVCDPEAIKNKHILLVDDVVTTGSTLEASGIVLLNSGIGKLSIAALAFAE